MIKFAEKITPCSPTEGTPATPSPRPAAWLRGRFPHEAFTWTGSLPQPTPSLGVLRITGWAAVVPGRLGLVVHTYPGTQLPRGVCPRPGGVLLGSAGHRVLPGRGACGLLHSSWGPGCSLGDRIALPRATVLSASRNCSSHRSPRGALVARHTHSLIFCFCPRGEFMRTSLEKPRCPVAGALSVDGTLLLQGPGLFPLQPPPQGGPSVFRCVCSVT